MSDALSKLKSVVNGITYKPGWTFRVDMLQMKNSIRIIKSSFEPDSDYPDKFKKIGCEKTFLLSEIESMWVEDIKGLIYEWIVKIEMHEIQEWLRFDGKHYIDAHSNYNGE